MTESGQQQWTVSWVTEEDDDEEEEEEEEEATVPVPVSVPANEMIFGVTADCIQLPSQAQDAHEVVMAEALTELKPILTDMSGGGPVYLDDPHNLATADHEVVVEAPDVGGDVVAASETVVDHNADQFSYQDPEFFGVQVTEEEVISEVWDNGQPVDDGQVLVSTVTVPPDWGGEARNEDDVLIPLPEDQASGSSQVRPYPCDFCSRRFSKKANLMNHMVAHQVERPYGCNLCGARYRRKCDLHNHLKIHAYAPMAVDHPDEDEEAGSPTFRGDAMETKNRRKQAQATMPKRRKYGEYFPEQIPVMKRRKKVGRTKGSTAAAMAARKRNAALAAAAAAAAAAATAAERSARPNYVDEDMRLMSELASRSNGANGANGYYLNGEVVSKAVLEPEPPQWPVTDPNKPYVCQHCGIGFAREKALGSHSRIHAGDSPFECSSCGEMFWDVHLLKEHTRIKHPGAAAAAATAAAAAAGLKIERDEDDDFGDRPYTGDERFGNFRCHTCGLEFHRQDLLKKHSRLHVKLEAGAGGGGGGGGGGGSGAADADGEGASGRSFACSVCGQTYSTRRTLLAHTESHSRYQPHRCMLCGQGFPDDQLVAAHVREHHAGSIPPNACTLCGKTCKDRRALQKHSWVHSTERSYSCPKCDKRFHSRARLRRHMVSHRERVLTCAECHATFPDGRSLVNHRLAVHSARDSAGRLFQCCDCGKTFGSRSSQQIHIRIHTGERPYACRFCWKAFADGGTLRKHERIHTGEKPYACPICPRAFNQRVVLREHIRAHHSGPDLKNASNGGAYACKVCGTTLATSEDLCLHLVKHSDENTARHRKPNLAPRKYKRRRRLKPHEVDSQEENLGNDSDSSDSIHKRKVVRPKNRPDYESMVRSFDAAVDTINSMVGQVRSDHEKAKLKKKKKLKRRALMLAEASSHDRLNTDHHDYPGTSGLASENMDYSVDVKPSVNRIRPRIKNVSMAQRTPLRLPKAMRTAAHLPPTPVPPQEDPAGLKVRKGPRTKNVNYHHEKKKSLPSAKFPKEPRERERERDRERDRDRDRDRERERESRDIRKIKGRKPIRKPKFLTQNGDLRKDLFVGRKGASATSSAPSFAAPAPHAEATSSPASAAAPAHAPAPGQSTVSPTPPSPPPQQMMQVVVKEEVREEFKCEICGEIFYTRPELLFHVSIHI